MSIEQKPIHWRASQFFAGSGLTRSPVTIAVPAIQPKADFFLGGGGGGGRSCATGTPLLVTKTVSRVFRTRSMIARQVALNLDTGMLFILTLHSVLLLMYDSKYFTMVNDHGQLIVNKMFHRLPGKSLISYPSAPSPPAGPSPPGIPATLLRPSRRGSPGSPGRPVRWPGPSRRRR